MWLLWMNYSHKTTYWENNIRVRYWNTMYKETTSINAKINLNVSHLRLQLLYITLFAFKTEKQSRWKPSCTHTQKQTFFLLRRVLSTQYQSVILIHIKRNAHKCVCMCTYTYINQKLNLWVAGKLQPENASSI